MMKIFFFLLMNMTLFASFDFDDPCMQFDCSFLPANNKCASEDSQKSSDVYLSIDFLYWEGRERGLEYALKNSESAFNQIVQVYKPSFRFHPAFRVGIGTQLGHDNWDVAFSYTRYYTSSNNSTTHLFSGNPHGGILSPWTSSTAFSGNNYQALWQNSEAHWKLHTHIVDLFLEHDFCLSSLISIDPGFGLKFAIIQQRYKVEYENGSTGQDASGNPIQFISSQISMKNRSFNLGMGAKIDSKWSLSDHFDLIGNLRASLMATNFEVGRNEYDVSTNTQNGVFFESYRESDDYWTIRPMASILLGIGWSQCLATPKKAIQYGLNAAYEANVFWKQNMLLRFIDQTNAGMLSPSQGNLFLHGFNLEAFIDF